MFCKAIHMNGFILISYKRRIYSLYRNKFEVIKHDVRKEQGSD